MKITKAETIRRLRALPLDEPFCDRERCPVEQVLELPAHTFGRFDGKPPRWLRTSSLWNCPDNEYFWAALTPRQCLEALGAEP